MTRCGTPSRAAASTVASTTPAPLMSVFIVTMPSRGLMLMPPLSKVMPLPTSTTCERCSPRRPRGGVQATRTSAGGVADPPPTASRPPNPPAARAAASSTSTSTPGTSRASSTAVAATHIGFFTDDGVVARSRASQVARQVDTACWTAWATSGSPAEPVQDEGPDRAGRGARPGARCLPGAQQQALDQRADVLGVEPVGQADRGPLDPGQRAAERRTGAAQRADRAVARPDQHDPARTAVARRGDGEGEQRRPRSR